MPGVVYAVQARRRLERSMRSSSFSLKNARALSLFNPRKESELSYVAGLMVHIAVLEVPVA